uniref:Uncharacterized protein n=1 Tax=Oryzias latipes TaxID=8090 RepID=H2N1W0_ORYLA
YFNYSSAGSFLMKLVGNRNDDGKVGSKQLTLAEATGKSMADANAESEMLAELKKFRKENMDSFCDLKSSLNRLENTMEELKQRTEGLDKRLTEVEDRVSAKEDSHIQHEKVLSYLLHREASLASKCDDMENRLRLLAFQLRKAQANRSVAKILRPQRK